MRNRIQYAVCTTAEMLNVEVEYGRICKKRRLQKKDLVEYARRSCCRNRICKEGCNVEIEYGKICKYGRNVEVEYGRLSKKESVEARMVSSQALACDLSLKPGQNLVEHTNLDFLALSTINK